LTGEEIRGCWEGWPAGAATTSTPLTIAPARASDDDRRPLAFVEVTPVTEPSGDADALETPAGTTPAASPLPPVGEPRWSLWGDADR
jgi:hypothetical protein